MGRGDRDTYGNPHDREHAESVNRTHPKRIANQEKGDPVKTKNLLNAFGILIVDSLLAPLAASAAAAPAGTVNVNTASAEQLQLLPRIGPSVAQRILDYRKENGKFGSVDDLMLVRGIGESTFAQLKPYVSLSGDTTLSHKVKVARGGKPAQTAAAGKPAQSGEAKP